MTDEGEDALDRGVIEGLRALDPEGEDGLLAELVDLFLADTPTRMTNLEQALETGDAKTVEEAAHSLKSSCGNLGAVRLSGLFKEIEALGREDRLDPVRELVQRTGHEFRRVESALLKEIS